jgi:nucleotide-binding universal stress UspA family protein
MRSILLHIYEDAALEGRLQSAFDVARAFGAHLTCLHATPFEDYLALDPLVVAELPEEFSEKMKRRRLELQERIEERLKTEGMVWDWLHEDDLLSTALVRHSALSDLVIVSLAGAAFMRDDPRPLAAKVAMQSPTPVLGIPQGADRFDVGAPAIIAWNGSPEAAAAVKGSLPLLSRASRVQLLQVEARESVYPKDRLARYLARHDIHVEIVERRRDGRVSEVIHEAAREARAGLIVMGAYGHSRLRELLLGGVTRNLLVDSEVPLLLAH